MTIEMKKVWFVDGQIIEQEIPESDIYKRPWNIDACKEYVKQLRDKTRANTAEHAAEAIEYLLTLAQPEQEPVGYVVADEDAYWIDKPPPLGSDLYTSPPQRQPLTNGELYTAYITATDQTLRPQDERLVFAFARAIEAAHDIGDKT